MASTDTNPIRSEDLDLLFEKLATYRWIFLAVSGGADSSALMRLVAEWCQTRDGPQPEVCVLTVNHGLRREAASEADAVVAQADQLGLSAERLDWPGVKPETGLQEAARVARYDLMLGHIRQVVADPSEACLVTGHHRDDAAETLLMRLARGGGVDGLAGIPELSYRDEIAVIRPLLDVPKSRLRATLSAAGASWADDPSNQDIKFERVQLRAAAAARTELGLNDVALSLTAKRMARARRALEAMTTDWLAPHLQEPGLARSGVFVWPGQIGNIDDEIAIRSMMLLLPAIGGTDQPPRLLRAERLWVDMQRIDFAGATLCNCVIRRGTGADVYIYREPERGSLPEIDTQPGQRLIWDNRFEVKSNRRLRVRPFTRPDLDVFDFDPEAQGVPYPVDALRSTPVIADADGLLAIPALNVHRLGACEQIARQFTCRFLLERLHELESSRARMRMNRSLTY